MNPEQPAPALKFFDVSAALHASLARMRNAIHKRDDCIRITRESPPTTFPTPEIKAFWGRCIADLEKLAANFDRTLRGEIALATAYLEGDLDQEAASVSVLDTLLAQRTELLTRLIEDGDASLAGFK